MVNILSGFFSVPAMFGVSGTGSFLHCKNFSHFFNKKYWHILDINVWNFNKTLTNDIVSFKQPGPVL